MPHFIMYDVCIFGPLLCLFLCPTPVQYPNTWSQQVTVSQSPHLISPIVERCLLLLKAHVDALKANNRTAVKAHEHTLQAWILERLKEEALDLENPASTRVRALELLGKGAGLFDSTQTVVVENRTPDQIEAELNEKLALLFNC